MRTDGLNHYSIEHHKYGRGFAILTKYRRKDRNDLFMCRFGKTTTFYCRKHFELANEVWFADPVAPRRKRKKSREEILEEQLRGFFSSDATGQ